MAHRRRKHRQHRQRRHRRRVMGAFGMSERTKDMGVKILSIAGGFVLGNAINDTIDKILPKTTDPVTHLTSISKTTSNLTAAGEVGIGALLLLKKSRGTTGTIMKAAGGILAGAGIKRALKTMGVLTGYQSVPVIGRHRMAGYQSVPVIGANVPPQLAGKVPAQLQGYRVGAYTPSGSGVMGNADGGSGITSTSGGGYLG